MTGGISAATMAVANVGHHQIRHNTKNQSQDRRGRSAHSHIYTVALLAQEHSSSYEEGLRAPPRCTRGHSCHICTCLPPDINITIYMSMSN